jgi:cytochrome P450
MATTLERRVEDFSYPAPETVECPYPFYSAARAQGPVTQLPTGQFFVSRYEEVVRVAMEPATFSNFVGPLNAGSAGGEKVVGPSAEGSRYTPWPLPFSDPPEHRLKRQLCMKLVSPERLKSYEPMIRRLIDELVDAFVGRGEVEFISEFAELLPLRLMLEVFGLPRESQDKFRRQRQFQGLGMIFATEAEKQAAAESRKQSAGYFRELILERQARPGEDFLSEMIRMQLERDGKFEEAYLTAEVTNLFGAGNGTTAHMLANTMMLVCVHQEQAAGVKDRPELVRQLIEESLRLESPVQWLQRIVTRDTELGGVKIPEGSLVLISWGSANRDESRWEDPEAFLLDRANLKDELAFGRGIHMCVGAPLARLEGRLAFEILLRRLANPRLSAQNDLSHIPGYGALRGLRALYVEFDAA